MKLVGSLLVCLHLASSLQCLDSSNNAVDWWVLYKLPELGTSSNPTVQQGYGFFYTDPNTSWSIGTTTLDQAQDALAMTLSPLYTGATGSVGWMMWNDEHPDGSTCSSCGHSKGVMGWDANGGWWLTHSTPRFPLDTFSASDAFPSALKLKQKLQHPHEWKNSHARAMAKAQSSAHEAAAALDIELNGAVGVNSTGSYSFPENERIYGQTFLCISVPFAEIDAVSKQLTYVSPGIYDSNMPSSLGSQLPVTEALIQGQFITSAGTSTGTINSLAGVQFTSYTKTAAWGQDIYESLVSPAIGSGLLVETWMRPKLASFCPPQYQYPSLDIDNLSFGGDMTFKETKDHAKWAVSTTASLNILCIGDINHQLTQYARAGGTVCVANPTLFTTFNGLITTADSC
jgi:deoxyribonuclease-2